MPRRPDPKFAKSRAVRAAVSCGAFFFSQSCMEPLYFEGPPPAPATMSVSVRSVDTLADTPAVGRFLVRAHLALEWNVVPSDFRGHPHLVDLQDGSKNHSRRIQLPGPSDSLVDTFTCEPGQITARLVADLGSGYFLELSQWSVPTKATGP